MSVTEIEVTVKLKLQFVCFFEAVIVILMQEDNTFFNHLKQVDIVNLSLEKEVVDGVHFVS